MTSSLASFDPAKNPALDRVASDDTLPSYDADKDFWVVGHDLSAELNDLPVFTTVAGTIQLESATPLASREEVQDVPGCFLIRNVLSRRECDQIIKLTETLGFTEDGLNARWLGRRNENCLWLVDDQLCVSLFERCKLFFPSVVAGGAVCGLNCRWRVYKYNPGDAYVAHIDSSFPGSGLDIAGRLVRDRYGDRWSRLTFVAYLNDDFKGGSTRFFVPVPGAGEPRTAEVQARMGAAICFFHGDHSQSLNMPHEGALVEAGTKYVFRTDVLYMLPQASQTPQPQMGPVLPPQEVASSSRIRSRSPRGRRWWTEAQTIDDLNLKALLQLCSFTLLHRRSAAVVRAALGAGDGSTPGHPWLGWNGRAIELSTSSTHPFLFFPTLPNSGQNAFSLERHRGGTAKVVPSTDFWFWLLASKQAWQMRGELNLSATQVAELIGQNLASAVEKHIFRVTQISVWSGKGGTRTPLHSDSVHALIFQLAGTKRFFLSSRAEVEAAVAKGLLPDAVMSEHCAASRTDAFCLDGSLEELHGLDAAQPKRAHGCIAALSPGDCLVLPAGVYHDVECSVEQPASMSVTVRFALDEWNCDTSSDEEDSASEQT